MTWGLAAFLPHAVMAGRMDGERGRSRNLSWDGRDEQVLQE